MAIFGCLSKFLQSETGQVITMQTGVVGRAGAFHFRDVRLLVGWGIDIDCVSRFFFQLEAQAGINGLGKRLHTLYRL